MTDQEKPIWRLTERFAHHSYGDVYMFHRDPPHAEGNCLIPVAMFWGAR